MNKLFILILLAAALRILFVTTVNMPLQPDSYKYESIAQSIIIGQGFENTLSTPPAYPLFLACIFLFFGKSYFIVKVFQAVISVLVVVLTYKMARLYFNEKTGLYAGLLCALDPFQIYYTGQILTETLFILFFMSFIYLLMKSMRNHKVSLAIIAGGILSLTVLTRSMLFGYIFLLLSILMVIKKIDLDMRMLAFCCFVAFMIGISPWMIRNYMLTKRIIPVSVQMGRSMYEGLNPEFENMPAIEQWQKQMINETREMDIFEQDVYFSKKALNIIKQNPGYTFKLGMRKLVKFWRLYPYNPPFSLKVQLISFIYFAPLLVLAVGGVWINIRQFQNFLPLFVLLFYFSLVAILFWTQIRYRVPLNPVLAFLGSSALYKLLYGRRDVQS